HTYLDGTSPFTYLGPWAVGASHSTATLSAGGPRGLYGLRLMHRLNISLSCFGPRAGQAFFMLACGPNPNPIRRLAMTEVEMYLRLCKIRQIIGLIPRRTLGICTIRKE
ncbi:hypothetical protein C8Q78DRAFT_964233, partial [Trametes maxima]